MKELQLHVQWITYIDHFRLDRENQYEYVYRFRIWITRMEYDWYDSANMNYEVTEIINRIVPHKSFHSGSDQNILKWNLDDISLTWTRPCKRPRSVWNFLWGNALYRSPGINHKSRALYPGPGFLSNATWPSMPKKHYNGFLISLVLTNIIK